MGVLTAKAKNDIFPQKPLTTKMKSVRITRLRRKAQHHPKKT